MANLSPVCDFTPAEYVDKLRDISLADYTASPNGCAGVRSYFCGNKDIDPNPENAIAFRTAWNEIALKRPEMKAVQNAKFNRIFSGQGDSEDFKQLFEMVIKFADDFKAKPALASFFGDDDFLNNLAAARCWGIDCIGFVGNFLAQSGALPSYPGLRPIDYHQHFPYVKSLDEVKDNNIALVIFTNGMHIQMIDHVIRRQVGSITVKLCQSSKGGPQANDGVTISEVSKGMYIKVQEFRAAIAAGEGTDAALRKSKKYEAEGHTGYLGGTIFQVGGDGTPANPSGGFYVYVGYAKQGLRAHPVPNSTE